MCAVLFAGAHWGCSGTHRPCSGAHKRCLTHTRFRAVDSTNPDSESKSTVLEPIGAELDHANSALDETRANVGAMMEHVGLAAVQRHKMSNPSKLVWMRTTTKTWAKIMYPYRPLKLIKRFQGWGTCYSVSHATTLITFY